MARILVVDDEADVRKTLRRMLERGGHEVSEAANGVEAVKCFAPCAPDLMIIDMIMPKREGIETIRDLRTAGVTTPIIAISGGGRTGTKVALEAATILGADHRLAKPVRRAELLAAVEACLAPAPA